MEQLTIGSDDPPDWQRLRGVLDQAMSELSEADYDALALRYYGDRDFRTVGQALGVTDDTAQKRATRALEKLREILIRYRIQSTSAALSTILAANDVQAAPPDASRRDLFRGAHRRRWRHDGHDYCSNYCDDYIPKDTHRCNLRYPGRRRTL